MSDLVFLIAFWKRPEITRVVMRHYRRLADRIPGLDLVAVGSEGDASKRLAEENGWEYLEAPNNPLSDKLAVGVRRCKELDPNGGIVAMGSDDIVTEPWVRRCMAERRVMLGLRDMYRFRIATWEAVHWLGYTGKRRGESIGAHRFFPRHVLERLGWELWPPGLNQNLDGNLYRKLGLLHRGPVPGAVDVLSMAEAGCVAVGLHAEETLTPWQYIVPGAIGVASETMLRLLPPETADDIRALRGVQGKRSGVPSK